MTPTQRWERAAEWPLMVAAVAFLAAYAIPILDPALGPAALGTLRRVSWLTWALFALDYLARLVLADHKHSYVLRHLLDLAVIALPLLRPLRLLRLVPLLRVLNRRAATTLRGRVAVYVAGGSALIAFCGALAVLDAERANPEANITTFGDAAWWAVTTMTTVGYADRFPSTGVGRLAAVGLMVAGIALLGTVTATLASWLVEQINVAQEEEVLDLQAEVSELHRKLDALLEGQAAPGGGEGVRESGRL